MPNITSNIKTRPVSKISFHRMEFQNMEFETDTARCVEFKKNMSYPDDAMYAWFDNVCYGVYFVRGNTAYYTGYIPKFLYQTNPNSHFIKDGVPVNVGIGPIDNLTNASLRFMTMIEEYKTRYGLDVLEQIKR